MSVCLPACLPVRMKQLGCRWTDFHEIWYLSIFRKSVEKIQVSVQSDNNNGTLHEDRYTFMVISRCILLQMRNVSHKSCRENYSTHFVFNKFLLKIVPFMRQYGKMWYSNRQVRCDNITQRMCIACWITGATGTHSEYVTHCFSTTTMVMRTRLIITLYFACLVYFHFVTGGCGRRSGQQL